MPRLDERMSVTSYLKASMRTVDGMAWVLTCAASVICLLDIYIGTNVIPLRYRTNPDKAVILLFFSPLLIFGILIRLRQLHLGSYRTAEYIRAALCVFVFFFFNLYKG